MQQLNVVIKVTGYLDIVGLIDLQIYKSNFFRFPKMPCLFLTWLLDTVWQQHVVIYSLVPGDSQHPGVEYADCSTWQGAAKFCIAAYTSDHETAAEVFIFQFLPGMFIGTV